MSEAPPMLEVDDLRVVFSTPAGTLTAVDGVSLQLAEKESIAIVGESGSGKSVFARTLIDLLAGNGTRTGSIASVATTSTNSPRTSASTSSVSRWRWSSRTR